MLVCVWSTFRPPSHQAISNLSTDLDSLGPGGGNKAICKVMGSEMKKILLETPFLSYYLPSIHVRLCVWSLFWPSFYQTILNLNTDLDFLGQEASNEAFL